MANIMNEREFILEHLSHECISDSLEYSAENTGSVLSPQEVAAKIWEQWTRCRLLSVELNCRFEFKINGSD
jgi:hypothetical protein